MIKVGFEKQVTEVQNKRKTIVLNPIFGYFFKLSARAIVSRFFISYDNENTCKKSFSSLSNSDFKNNSLKDEKKKKLYEVLTWVKNGKLNCF